MGDAEDLLERRFESALKDANTSFDPVPADACSS